MVRIKRRLTDRPTVLKDFQWALLIPKADLYKWTDKELNEEFDKLKAEAIQFVNENREFLKKIVERSTHA